MPWSARPRGCQVSPRTPTDESRTASSSVRARRPVARLPRKADTNEHQVRELITQSPAFHYEPETNGVVEKFIQTLKAQVLWIERIDTLEQLRARIRQFAADYNEHSLLERHGYRTPRQAREALGQPAMA